MKVPNIPLDIQFNPAPVNCGPFIPAVNFATRATPEGQWFLGIANPNTGRCVARVSALELLDREDMGLAYLFAAAPDLLAMCEEALEREEDAGESAGSIGFIRKLRAVIAKAKGEEYED